MSQPFPLIALSGGVRERGLTYGRLAGERIHKSAGHYAEQLCAMGLDGAGIDALVERLVPGMTAFDADYVAEMRYIAEGAEIPFSAIAMINARTEMLKLAARAGLASKEIDENPDGCTSVVVLPEATQNGSLIHAQNWDWKVECAETGVVLSIQQQGKPDILTFTEAGGLARSGLNSAGIAITANYLESDRDYGRLGVPLALIRRKALDSSYLANAIRAVYATPKSASNNIVLSHADGIGLNFECAPDETFMLHAENGLLVHANHWTSPIALAKLKDTGLENVPDSLYRDMRVRQLLTPHIGRITTEHVSAALFDDFQTPFSVCRPERMSFTNNLSATVAMFVMEPASGTMRVTPLPASNTISTDYQLERPPSYGGSA
jgi:isopenicillin-N N-acyltransferase-like protein